MFLPPPHRQSALRRQWVAALTPSSSSRTWSSSSSCSSRSPLRTPVHLRVGSLRVLARHALCRAAARAHRAGWCSAESRTPRRPRCWDSSGGLGARWRAQGVHGNCRKERGHLELSLRFVRASEHALKTPCSGLLVERACERGSVMSCLTAHLS
jgi:hypothetical protein